ncbi:MAG: cytochrome c [Acidobacteria bacterium]|nr:cytochrome c [Acidobacteriota bacterium]
MKKLHLSAIVLVLYGAASFATAADLEAGKKKAAEVCAACHGPDGNSQAADFPRVAGQHPDYLRKALRDYRSGARKDAVMAGFAKGLTDQDIANLAAYFASQSGLSIKY